MAFDGGLLVPNPIGAKNKMAQSFHTWEKFKETFLNLRYLIIGEDSMYGLKSRQGSKHKKTKLFD